MALLERHAREERRASAFDRLFVVSLILLVLVIAAIPFLLAGRLIRVVARLF